MMREYLAIEWDGRRRGPLSVASLDKFRREHPEQGLRHSLALIVKPAELAELRRAMAPFDVGPPDRTSVTTVCGVRLLLDAL